jgi:hypothetical protein
MKKSIVVNSMNDTNLFAIVIKTWDLDIDSNPINILSQTKINQTWEQVIEKINNL